MKNEIEQHAYKSDGYFGLIKGPWYKTSAQDGTLSKYPYVTLLNIATGETLVKRVYENKRGAYFKHSVRTWRASYSLPRSVFYLSAFTKTVVCVPYQTFIY